MFLILYDIKSGSNPSGLRIQLVRSLRKDGGIQLQRSVWLTPMLSDETLKMLMRVKILGGSVVFSEFKPFNPIIEQSMPLNIGVIVQGSLCVLSPLLSSVKSILKDEKVNVVVKSSGRYMSERSKPLPSVVADQLCKRGVDTILLLTHSNSIENGMYMGFEIYENSLLLRYLNIPFSELLCVKDAAKPVFISWVKDADAFLESCFHKKMNLAVINGCIIPRRIEEKDRVIYRKVLGVRPGEQLFVDGVAVGEVSGDEVILVASAGRLIKIIGAIPYDAMKKLRKVNIQRALVKSL